MRFYLSVITTTSIPVTIFYLSFFFATLVSARGLGFSREVAVFSFLKYYTLVLTLL